MSEEERQAFKDANHEEIQAGLSKAHDKVEEFAEAHRAQIREKVNEAHEAVDKVKSAVEHWNDMTEVEKFKFLHHLREKFPILPSP